MLLVEAPGKRVTVQLVFVEARNLDLFGSVALVAWLSPARQPIAARINRGVELDLIKSRFRLSDDTGDRLLLLRL